MIWVLAAFAGPPEGWREVEAIDGVEIEVRYATSDNFTGRPLDGYTMPGAWMREAPFEGLVEAAHAARKRGYHLRVYDAYRPERASRDMVAWAEETGNTSLLRDGYVAARSGHNKGHTIDLTLVGVEGPLDMGTPYDTFSEAAHTANATGHVAKNRQALIEIMKVGGFRNYSKEWWHFSHGSGPYEPIDVPYAPDPAE